MPRRKPGDCVCNCHLTGMTGALGPCGWCADLHRPKAKQAAAQLDGLATGGVVSKEAAQDIGRSIGQHGCVFPSPEHSDGGESDG